MKIIWKYLKDYKKECVIAPLFKMLEALLELFVPLVIASIIDKGITGANYPFIGGRCGMLIGFAVFGLTCSLIAQYFSAKAAVGCASNMRFHLFKHIQSLSFTEMDEIGSSTLITRMTSDINQVQSGINLVLRLFLRSPFIVFGAMAMAFTIDVKAAMIFVVTIPVLAVVVFGIMLSTRPLYRKVQGKLDKVLQITHENLAGVRVIRAFNKENDEITEFRAENEKLNQMQKFVGRISGLMNPFTYLIINAAIIILIWNGAIRVNAGTLSQGQVVALYNYMSQILVELIKLANLVINISKALACSKRIEAVFDMDSSMIDGTLSEGLDSQDTHIPVVEFRNVSFKYAGAGAESLKDVSFQAFQGETIGIIGGTGAGKSSLVQLIGRFYDATAGEVRIKNRDIKEYQIDYLRSKIGMVFQKNMLFKGNIRDNLKWGNPLAEEKDYKNAVEISQAQEFVEQKEDGLDSYVEQGGKNLSGGQKQRLSIARALIRKPEILILDDSSSALDFATDIKLRQAIAQNQKQSTIFLVSQRATSLMYANRIIVLDDGGVAGIGTHEELLKSCETYQEIYYSQVKKEA